MWVTKLLISPVKKRIFCPKTTKFGPKLAYLVIWARPCWLIWCPVGGLAGGCGAGCISQDTYLLYVMISAWEGLLSYSILKTNTTRWLTNMFHHHSDPQQPVSPVLQAEVHQLDLLHQLLWTNCTNCTPFLHLKM